MTNKSHSPEKTPIIKRQLSYASVWRWHFYAGLFCIPFAIWLATTGAIYLFKPQVESWQERSFDSLQITGERATAQAQVTAALTAVPGTVLNAYILPDSEDSAVRVLVGKGKELTRVYLNPQTLEILRVQPEDERLMQLVHKLHGTLLLGDKGSMIVELAASWMIVLIITGLYLWWPRNASGLAGIVYPRLNQDGRTFWRDIHSVTGLWVSFFILFLLISGLPWAKSWGGMLKQVRQMNQTTVVKQDWTTGPSSEQALRVATNSPVVDEHEFHRGMGHAPAQAGYEQLDKLIDIVALQNLAPPVLISPPNKNNAVWSARSDSQNRMLRVNLKLDASTGEITERKDFASKPLLDKMIGIGISVHEGQLFGWFNQFLGLMTALGILLIAVSSVVMWWSRKPANTLGAPKAPKNQKLPLLLGLVIVVLGTLLPLLGLSLIFILMIEFALLCRITKVKAFLGLG
ncbi:MAG: PepSY domain-containing protein [Methylococcales bacterium]|nr:MAG: PepSY domain-containing protein [Methylococcales bacterium]